jgi:hypothetical protein
MIKKFFIEALCQPCDLCGKKKWDMIIRKRLSYRGRVVNRTCVDCKEEMEQKHAEEMRRQWF